MTADIFAIIGVGIALAGLILYQARGLNELRRDMTREIASLREQMHRENTALREQMHREIAALREQMHRENADLRERMSRLEGLFEGFTRRKSDKPE